MKPIMRNTLFGTILILGASTITQAQTTEALRATQREVQAEAVRPVIANGYSYSYGSDRQINEADLKTKEVSKEITVTKGNDIYIENSSRGIVVKTWDQQKVKVTTTVYYEGESKLTDEEWLEKINLSLKTLGNSVKIKSGSVGSNGMFYSYGGGNTVISGSRGGDVAVFNANGQNIGTKSNIKRVVTITVPTGSKLDIESKYADVQLPANAGDVSVDITNGNLEAENINKLVLRSKYSNVNVGDIKTAEVEFMNGRFSAKNIDDLDIDSKYSTIEMAAAKKIVLRSTNDEYELEEAGEVRGRKNYGNLRITKLNNSLEVDGSNADVRIRNVGPALTLIKLDDRYADVRIPLRNTKNYSLDFSGAYSSVYGNFEKKPVATTEKEKEEKTTTGSGTAAPTAAVIENHVGLTSGGRLMATTRPLNSMTWGEGNGPSRFTAVVGDGKGLKVDMKCQNCTVDFK
jgi:hypothetical protein